ATATDLTFNLDQPLGNGSGLGLAGGQVQHFAAVTPVPVPEPGTVSLLAIGIVALVMARWRRKRPLPLTPLHSARSIVSSHDPRARALSHWHTWSSLARS